MPFHPAVQYPAKATYFSKKPLINVNNPFGQMPENSLALLKTTTDITPMKLPPNSIGIFCLFIALGLCQACSNKTQPEGVLTPAQVQALKSAKQTEKILEDANQAQLKKIEDASGAP